LDVRCQVPLRHSVHLRVINVCCRGGWKSQDATPRPAVERLAPTYGQAPYFPAISSTIGGNCSGLDPYARHHICTIKLVQGIPIVTSILQSSAGASSSSSSATSLNQDTADDFLEIGRRTCGDPTEEGRLIVMVAPAR
jgi:hypothetical protein